MCLRELAFYCVFLFSSLADFLSRLKSLLPLSNARALPEPSLPVDFPEHCPGGLETLINKARSLDSEGPAKSLAVGQTSSAAGTRALEHVRDKIVAAAAVISVFGWQLAPTAPPDVSSASPQSKGRGSSTIGDAGGRVRKRDDASPSPAASGKLRLWCSACNRRVLSDNFLAVETASSRASGAAEAALSTASGKGGGNKGTKRRRLSGGGTPLKAMDLAGEHRSFCPWTNVHPLAEGETSWWKSIYTALTISVARLCCSGSVQRRGCGRLCGQATCKRCSCAWHRRYTLAAGAPRLNTPLVFSPAVPQGASIAAENMLDQQHTMWGLFGVTGVHNGDQFQSVPVQSRRDYCICHVIQGARCMG